MTDKIDPPVHTVPSKSGGWDNKQGGKVMRVITDLRLLSQGKSIGV